MFPIYDVSRSVSDRPEALGTKEKFWLIPDGPSGLPAVPHLFKIGRPQTGENWAEKICCEILAHLEIPRAAYHFAIHDGDMGVVSERFMPLGASFIPANMILAQTVPDYDGKRRFRQFKYQLSTSLGMLRVLLGVHPPFGTPAKYRHLAAADFFVGYLLFDALVGNTDRHHENWGIVIIPNADPAAPAEFHLAPSFDHASSLGRNESDASRIRRLTTSDKRDSVEAYAMRSRTAFFGHANATKTLTQGELVRELRDAYPASTTFWATVLCAMDTSVFESIFARISPQLMSRDAAEFALRMLTHNQSTIREHALGQ
jgi:HipA-like C-terminal domain